MDNWRSGWNGCLRGNVHLSERLLVENISVREDARGSEVETEPGIGASNTRVEVRLIIGGVGHRVLISIERPDPENRVANGNVGDEAASGPMSPLNDNRIFRAVVWANDAAESDRKSDEKNSKREHAREFLSTKYE
jgi:hypothetical protein